MKREFLAIFFLLFVIRPVFSEVMSGTASIQLGTARVYQGDFLSFKININKTAGNISTGTLAYWVESEDGKRWAFESATLSTGKAPFQTSLEREVYIFSTQPSNTYYIKASVNFDDSSPAVTTDSSFYVLPKSESGLSAKIGISGIEKDVTAEATKPKYLRPIIRNNDDKSYHNVSLIIEGAGSDWFTLAPLSYPQAEPGQELSFTVEVSVPLDSKTGDYPFTILVVTSEGEWNYHEFTLHTFASRHELISYDINLVEAEIADFRLDVQKSILEGRNATQALRLVSEVEVQVEFARQYLRSAKYDEASLALSNANDLLREAKSVDLSELTVQNRETNLIIIFGFAGLFMLFVLILVVYNNYSRKKFDKLMGVYATEILRNVRREVEPPGVVVRLKEGGIRGPELMEQVKQKMQEETVKGLIEKRERVKMFLDSIEEEFKSGKISHDSYEEIRGKSAERLDVLDDQLREKGVKIPSDKMVKEVLERQEDKAREEEAKRAGKKSLPQRLKALPDKLKNIVKGGGKSGKKEQKESGTKEKGDEENAGKSGGA